MRDVAKEAGVSVETVYGKFGSKADLLLAAIDVGGGRRRRARPALRAAGVRGTRIRRPRRPHRGRPRLLAGINARTSGLRRALGEAVGSEPDLAVAVDQLETRRRVNVGEAVAMVLGHPADDDVLDHLWGVLSAAVFHLLTGIGGRSVEDYERWAAGAIRRVLGVDGGREGR